MVYPGRSEPEGPSGVSVLDDIVVLSPAAGIAESTAAFFGKNGIWWGTWKSLQVKGGYDAILIIREIISDEQAAITYLTPDYPNWYVAAQRWETNATFVTREDGTRILRVPYAPAATTIDFWFERTRLRGIMYGRFMRQDITMKPLAGTGRAMGQGSRQ
jgi:hypothetical protein